MSRMVDNVKALFDAAQAGGYTVKHGRMQIMLWHGSDKVGGWNTKDGHWYVSKGIARDHEELVRRYGFRWMTKSDGHCWWQLDGVDNAGAFQTVAAALTGVPFRL